MGPGDFGIDQATLDRIAADLVATHRVGREKHHHLNPVPIAQIADRWVGKYAQPFTRALLDVRSAAEGTHPRHEEQP